VDLRQLSICSACYDVGGIPKSWVEKLGDLEHVTVSL